MDLEASDLVNLLADDELNTKNEGLVLELIDKWVAKDEDDRIGYITDLINTVRSDPACRGTGEGPLVLRFIVLRFNSSTLQQS